MKKDDKRKQQKALQKRAKSKARRQSDSTGSMTTLHYIRQARSYPVESCWVQQGWDKSGLAVVVVVRRQPNGNLVFGNYLVDYYCLGVKDTYCNGNIPPGQFRREFMTKMFRSGVPVSISPALANEIVYGGIEYAAQFGFRPHRDFRLSQRVLDPPEMHPRTGAVEFGKDGKPFYISGPYDNADAIVRRLTRTAGEGNFHFMMQVAGPPPDELDDERHL